MKLSNSLLRAMLVAVTTGAIVSCEKPKIVDGKKAVIKNFKSVTQPADSIPGGCPFCGMG
jgi:hypothetical protein